MERKGRGRQESKTMRASPTCLNGSRYSLIRRGPNRLNVARGPAAPPGAAKFREAQSREAKQHHGPRRGFGNRGGSDDECEVLVRPGPPRPFVRAGRRAEAAEGLTVI